MFRILEALAQQAELPDLTTEVMLYLLEEICTNSELLHRLQELLSQPTEALSPDPKAFVLPTFKLRQHLIK